MVIIFKSFFYMVSQLSIYNLYLECPLLTLVINYIYSVFCELWFMFDCSNLTLNLLLFMSISRVFFINELYADHYPWVLCFFIILHFIIYSKFDILWILYKLFFCLCIKISCNDRILNCKLIIFLPSTLLLLICCGLRQWI